MRILHVEENSFEDKNNFTSNYKYLPASFVKLAEAYSAHAKGELNTHSLIVRVATFDTTYDYIDDGKSWRSWKDIHKKLLADIAQSEDFTQEEKSILTEGTYNHGVDAFREAFPYSRIHWNADRVSPEIEEFINGEYDEVRLEQIQKTIDELSTIWDSNNIPDNRDNIIYTKACPHPKLLTGKLTVSDVGQRTVLNFETAITKRDIEYYLRWAPKLTFYGTTLYGSDRVTVNMTKFKRNVYLSSISPISLSDGSVTRGYRFFHSNIDIRGCITLVIK